MASADWSIPLGVLIFIIAIIIATIYYIRYKKFSHVLYVVSIATYTFSVFYTLDVFELNRNWILGILVFSTLLMFWLANYFKKIESKK